jgi:8-amino-7-oxononanoate synthase
VVNFSSNDYLGLSSHPQVIAAATEALNVYGAGARASRLVTGNSPVHEELEAELARFKGTEAALVFSSGYLANVGVIQVLSRRADGSTVPVFMDKLSHACIVDGALATGKWRTFAHNDVGALRGLLEGARSAASPRALVVTEGVFSMDGDVAPIAELLALCQEFDALLVIDDAHGTGTIGDGGRGTLSHFGIAARPRVIQIGTLSKALGSQGGFVAASQVIVDLLINRARTFIFDTGLAPTAAAAALAALRVLQAEPGRVGRLQSKAAELRKLLGHPDRVTPIIPHIVGDAEAAVELSRRLLEAGYLVSAIRPPTVPPGTSRLRIAMSSEHEIGQLEGVAKLLGCAG